MSYETRRLVTQKMKYSGASIILSSDLKEACSGFYSVKFIEDPEVHYPYTCMQYCAGCLTTNPERYNAYMRFRDYKCESGSIDMEFLGWLIDNEKLEYSSKSEASIVTYWDGTSPLHIGFLNRDGTLLSKWGVGGPLVEHGLFEVPSSYGSIVKWHTWSSEYEIIELINEFLNEAS